MVWSKGEKDFLIRAYKDTTFKDIAKALDKKESTVRIMAKRLGLTKQYKEVGKKKCSKCDFIYPASTEFFPTDKSKKDGLHYYCKDCHREYRFKKKAGTKKCNNCELIKCKLEFQVRKNNKDGLDTICKDCRSIKQTAYRRKATRRIITSPRNLEEERKKIEIYMKKYGDKY